MACFAMRRSGNNVAAPERAPPKTTVWGYPWGCTQLCSGPMSLTWLLRGQGGGTAQKMPFFYDFSVEKIPSFFFFFSIPGFALKEVVQRQRGRLCIFASSNCASKLNLAFLRLLVFFQLYPSAVADCIAEASVILLCCFVSSHGHL